MWPLLWGGLAYSSGAVANFLWRPVLIPGAVHAHELFHVAVLAGAASHFVFVWRVTVRDVGSQPLQITVFPA